MSGLVVENYRGVRVPRSLGLVLAGAAWIATVAWAGLRFAGEPAWTALVGCLLVFAAGLVDDVVPSGPRGLWNHIGELANGRISTGVVKLIVAVGAAVVVVAAQPDHTWWARVLGAVLISASTNVWNGLDVRPGRALKAFLPVGTAFVASADVGLAPAVLGVAVGAVVVLPSDLSERAMLGDSGSNLLGFAAGLALYLVLPGWATTVAAVAGVALNVLAETLTLSRAIESVPPLRWVDGLGRRPDRGGG